MSVEANQLLGNQRSHLSFKTWVLLRCHIHHICYFLFRCWGQTWLTTIRPCLGTLIGRKQKCGSTRDRKLSKWWHIQPGPMVNKIMTAELGTPPVKLSYAAVRSRSTKSLYSRSSKYLGFSLSLNTVLSFGTFTFCPV